MKSNLNYTIQCQITVSNYIVFYSNRLAAAKYFKMDIQLYTTDHVQVTLTNFNNYYESVYSNYLLICIFIYLCFDLYYLYISLSFILGYTNLLLYKLYFSICYFMNLLQFFNLN